MLITRSIVLISFLLASFAGFGVELKPVYKGPEQHEQRAARYLSLCDKVEEIVNSEVFKQKVLEKKFTSTQKTSAEVLETIYSASETLLPGSNGIWEWELGFYYKKNSKVIGYTTAKILTVWVNTAKFDFMDDYSVMANITHEYMHKIGFDHASASDHKSVPYAVGYLVEEIARNKANTQDVNSTQPIKSSRSSLWDRLRSWMKAKF